MNIKKKFKKCLFMISIIVIYIMFINFNIYTEHVFTIFILKKIVFKNANKRNFKSGKHKK